MKLKVNGKCLTVDWKLDFCIFMWLWMVGLGQLIKEMYHRVCIVVLLWRWIVW